MAADKLLPPLQILRSLAALEGPGHLQGTQTHVAVWPFVQAKPGSQSQTVSHRLLDQNNQQDAQMQGIGAGQEHCAMPLRKGCYFCAVALGMSLAADLLRLSVLDVRVSVCDNKS